VTTPAPPGSLEQRLTDLEAGLRSLLTGNWTERASVVNAAGRWVPLSSLAFGMVTAADLGLTTVDGVASTVGSAGWFYGSPVADVYVNGGGLLVFTAGALSASGNKCSMYQSYRLLGPTATAGAAAGVAVGPAQDRAIEVQHSHSGQDQRAAAGTFGVHTGLAAGWYRIESAYMIAYSSSALTPSGGARNRRLAALPF
jgi:hypothetical protein